MQTLDPILKNDGAYESVEEAMKKLDEDYRLEAEERKEHEMKAFMKMHQKTKEETFVLHQRFLRKKEEDKCKNGKPQNAQLLFPSSIIQNSSPESVAVKEELPQVSQKRIKRSNEVSPDLGNFRFPEKKEFTINYQSHLQAAMTPLRMSTPSSTITTPSFSQISTQLPTIPQSQFQPSATGNQQGLAYLNMAQRQKNPYQNHSGIQQSNDQVSGVFNSRVPDLYGLNQGNIANANQVTNLQNGFAMHGSHNFLHNYYWPNGHPALQQGSGIGNMAYSQIQSAQNLRPNFPTTQPHFYGLNGNVEQRNYTNNGYNGMAVANQWNLPMQGPGSAQSYYPSSATHIREQNAPHFSGHQNMQQNFVVNPTAGPSPSNSSIHSGPPSSSTQSVKAEFSPSSSSGHTPTNPNQNSANLIIPDLTKMDRPQHEQGNINKPANQCNGSNNWPNNYGALDPSYMVGMGMSNGNNLASDEIRNELSVYLGPGHCESETPMSSSTFARSHTNYYDYSGNQVYNNLK